jgi:transposase
MVSLWKRQTVEGMSSLFTGKANRHDVSQETRIKELHEKIGQLTVERDFLARAFGR